MRHRPCLPNRGSDASRRETVYAFTRRTPCTLGLQDYAPVPVDVDALSSSEVDSAADRQSLLCLVAAAPRLPHRARSFRRGGGAAVLLHAVVVTTLLAVTGWSRAASEPPTALASSRQPLQLPRMIFLQVPGPGGGGGGGGNRQPKPASRAQAPGRDRVTLPVARPIIPSEQPKDVTPPPQQLVLDAKPLAAGTTFLTGLPDASPSLPFSQGPGFGGGVGDGTGSGIGPGTGPGVGPGSGGGSGGGAYRPGSGVTPPTVLKEVKPKYTSEALRQRIQGTVALEVVVSRDGVPIAVRVTRSIDPGGLDHEAILAAREWRFTPGRIGETPVDVLVTILLDFRLH